MAQNIKRFAASAKQSAFSEGVAPLEFELADRRLICHVPTAAQFTIMISMVSDEDDIVSQVKGLMFFFESVFAHEDFVWLEAQMKTGVVDLDVLMEIIEWVIEEWTDRPFEQSSDSSPSQRTRSRPSTASA